MSSAALWDLELERVKRRLARRRERQAEHQDSLLGRIRAHLAFKDQQQELGEVDEWVAADSDDHDMGLDFLEGVDEEDMRTLLNEAASRMQPAENGELAAAATIQQQDQVQLEHAPIPMPESLISPTKASTATVSSAEISAIDMDIGGDVHLESETQAQVAVSVSLGGDADVAELLNELQLDLGNASVVSSNSSNTTTTATSTSKSVATNGSSRPAWQARSGQQPANHASGPKAKPATVSDRPQVQQQETQRTEHDAVSAEMVSWVTGYRDPEVVRRKENTPQRKRRATKRYGADTYEEQLSVRRAAKYYAQESDESSDSDSPDSAGSDFAPVGEEPEDTTRLDDEPLSDIELLSDDYLNSDEGSKRQLPRRRRLRKGVAANVSPQVNKARQPWQTRRSRRKQLEPTKRVDSSVGQRNGSHTPQVANTAKPSEKPRQTLAEQPAGKKQEQTIDLRSSDDEDTVIMGRSKDAHIVDLESTSNTDDSSATTKKNAGQVKQTMLQNELKDSLILRLKTPKSMDIREISPQTPLKADNAVATVEDDELSDTGTLNDGIMDDSGYDLGADAEVSSTPPPESIVGDTENLSIRIPNESVNVEDEYMSDTGTVVDYEDLSEAGTEDFEEEVPAQESTLEGQDTNSITTHTAERSLSSANLPLSQLSIEEKLAKAGLSTSMPAATEIEAPKKSETEVDIVVQASGLQTTKQLHMDTAEKSKEPHANASGDISDAETVDLAQVDEDDLGLDYSDDEEEDVEIVDQPTQKNDDNGVEQFDFDGSARTAVAKVKTKTSTLTRPAGTPKPKTIPMNATERKKPTEKAMKVNAPKKKALVSPLKETIGSNGLRKRPGNPPVETVPVTKGKFTYNRRAIKVLGSDSSKNQEKVAGTISAKITSRSTDSEKTTKRYLGYGKHKTGTEDDDSLDDEPLVRNTAPKSKYGGGGFDPPTQIPRDPFERRASEAIESDAPKTVFQFAREPQLSVYQALHLPEREESAVSLLGDDHKRPTKFTKSQEDKKKRGIAFISSIPVDLENAPIPKKPKAKAANGNASRYGGSTGQENKTNRDSNNNGRRDSGDRDRFQGGASRSWNANKNSGYSSKRSNSRRERPPSPDNRRNDYKNKKDYASRPQKQQKNNRSYETHDKYGPSSRSPPRDRSRDFRDKDSSFMDRRQGYDDRKRSRSRSNSRSRSVRNDREDNRGRKSFPARESKRMRDHSWSPQARRHDDLNSRPQQEDRPQPSHEKPSRINHDDNPRELKKPKHQGRPSEDENTIRAAPVSLASMDQDEFTYIVDSDIDDEEILTVEDEIASVVDIRFDLSSVPINESECDKCVYVTGINFSMDEGVLNEVFAPFGVQVRRLSSTCSFRIVHKRPNSVFY